MSQLSSVYLKILLHQLDVIGRNDCFQIFTLKKYGKKHFSKALELVR
jgi:hypothetical protein